ncbi:MAG: radical SAM protein, partial [Bacteroidota bacterium]
LAPMIPGINSHELIKLARVVAEHGARSFGFTVVRLNGAIGQLFTDWIRKTMPDRAEKVLHLIQDCHGGSINDSRYGIRSKGEGKVAEQIHEMARLAKKKYFADRRFPQLRTDLHQPFKTGQMRLF